MANTTIDPITVRVTVNEVARYLDLQARRRALLREADALQRIEAAIAHKLAAFAQANGGTAKKGKFRLALEEANGRVAWKTEFIRKNGEAAAKRIAAQQPTVTKLTVTGG